VTLSTPMPTTEIAKEGWFYLATYLQGDYGDAYRKPEGRSPKCTLLVRRAQVRRGPSGKEWTAIDTEALEFPNEAAMVEWIDAHNAEELPAEADGAPQYVPEGFHV
jgi:hypothetical protein